MVKSHRACPVCSSCGSKKFRVLENSERHVIVECLSCAKRISIQLWFDCRITRGDILWRQDIKEDNSDGSLLYQRLFSLHNGALIKVPNHKLINNPVMTQNNATIKTKEWFLKPSVPSVMSEICHKHIRSLKELLIGNKLDPIRPRIYYMGCSYAKINRAAAIQLLVDLQMSISLLNMKGEK